MVILGDEVREETPIGLLTSKTKRNRFTRRKCNHVGSGRFLPVGVRGRRLVLFCYILNIYGRQGCILKNTGPVGQNYYRCSCIWHHGPHSWSELPSVSLCFFFGIVALWELCCSWRGVGFAGLSYWQMKLSPSQLLTIEFCLSIKKFAPACYCEVIGFLAT